MKTSLLFTLGAACLLSVGTALGQARTEAEMESIASDFLQSTARHAPALWSTSAHETTQTLVTPVCKTTDYHIYAPAMGSGYVIVSTDRSQPAVLGFADSGTFAEEQMPPAMKAYLTATAGNAAVEHLQTRAEEDVEPLLGEIQFNQSEPFNNACPLYGEERTLTGCVATAMAQVMAYYKHPTQMSGDDIAYTSSTFSIPVTWSPASTQFDWDNILPQYKHPEVAYAEDESIGSGKILGATSLWATQGYLHLDSVWNCFSGSTFIGEMQLLLTTEDKTFIRPIGDPLSIEFQKYYCYYYVPLALGMPSDVADGDYRIYVGAKAEGSSEWTLVQRVNIRPYKNWQEQLYINVHKSGDRFTVDGYSYPVDYTETQATAVANLVGACGAAISADYGTGSTSAHTKDMFLALNNNFGYDDGSTYTYASNYPSTAQLEATIVNEVCAKRPVLASGVSEFGDAHQYVIDGVQTVGSLPYLHFNWGWGGIDDGWFLLNVDNTQNDDENSGNEYCYNFDLVTGIRPEDGIEAPFTFVCDSLSADKELYQQGDKIELTANRLYNRSARAFSNPSFKLYLTSEVGDTTFTIGTFYQSQKVSIIFSWGFKALTRTFTIPQNIPNGRYEVQVLPVIAGTETPGYVLYKSPLKIWIGEMESGIEELHADRKTKSVSRYTIDGRPIPADREVHGLLIEDGKVVRR